MDRHYITFWVAVKGTAREFTVFSVFAGHRLGMQTIVLEGSTTEVLSGV